MLRAATILPSMMTFLYPFRISSALSSQLSSSRFFFSGGVKGFTFEELGLLIILPGLGGRCFSLTSTTRLGNTNKRPKMSPTIQTYLFSPPWWRNLFLGPLPRHLSQQLYKHPSSKSPTIQPIWLESTNQYIIKSGHLPFKQKPHTCAIRDLLLTVEISGHHSPLGLSQKERAVM